MPKVADFEALYTVKSGNLVDRIADRFVWTAFDSASVGEPCWSLLLTLSSKDAGYRDNINGTSGNNMATMISEA